MYHAALLPDTWDVLRPYVVYLDPLVLLLIGDVHHYLGHPVVVVPVGEREGIHLAVPVPAGGGDPLDVPVSEPALVSEGVEVVDVSFGAYGDGLVTPMGVQREARCDLPSVHAVSVLRAVVMSQRSFLDLFQGRSLLSVSPGVVVEVVGCEHERVLSVPVKFRSLLPYDGAAVLYLSEESHGGVMALAIFWFLDGLTIGILNKMSRIGRLMAEEGVRLNKFIAEAGIASRRAADRLIEDGHVTLNGRPAVLGDKVLPEDTVCVDGNPIKRETGTAVILAFNKPRGLECTSDHGNEDNVIDFINYPKRIFTIGRLDKESEGLLLLTNDGDLANKIMRSRYGHEKEYVVSLDRDVTPEFIKGMASGVPIEEGVVTRKCKVFMEDPRTIRIILKQGLNRQIRKMCAYFGYGVVRLVRVRVMNIELGNLKSGRYRDISKKEREELMGILDKSTLAEKDN